MVLEETGDVLFEVILPEGPLVGLEFLELHQIHSFSHQLHHLPGFSTCCPDGVW